MGRRWMLGGLAGAIALVLPVSAHGSSVAYGGYAAAPGETNNLTIEVQDSAGTYSFTDTGVTTIDPGDPNDPYGAKVCTVEGNRATCPVPASSFVITAFSGDENDTIINFARADYSRIDGGSGDDLVDLSSGGGAFPGTYGGLGNDRLIGSPETDFLIGGSPPDGQGDVAPLPLPDNDRMDGLGGRDLLDGLVGDDSIDGGEGDDQLMGGEGNDLLLGGPGNDSLDWQQIRSCLTCPPVGGEGSDVQDGGAGNDAVVGAFDGGAPDDLACGEGNDVVLIGAGDRVHSGCEQVQQLVSCPQALLAGCEFTVQATAMAKARAKAGGQHRKRPRRLLLGMRTVGLRAGVSKFLTIGLRARRVALALKGDGKARGVLVTKAVRKKGISRPVARTRFGLER